MKTILIVVLTLLITVLTVMLAGVAYLILDEVKATWKRNRYLKEREGE